MSFKATNEVENFYFDDCEVVAMKVGDNVINFTLEALIVRKSNSQNTNFTDSYAATTELLLSEARIVGIKKDGYKYYDANEVLQGEVPDTPLTEDEIKTFPKMCQGAYFYFMDKVEEKDGLFYYDIGIEFVDTEENTMGDSYTISVAFEKSEFSWDRYLNRVQR